MIFFLTLIKIDLNSSDLKLRYTTRHDIVANSYFNLITDYIDRGIPIDQNLLYWNKALMKQQKKN